MQTGKGGKGEPRYSGTEKRFFFSKRSRGLEPKAERHNPPKKSNRTARGNCFGENKRSTEPNRKKRGAMKEKPLQKSLEKIQ